MNTTNTPAPNATDNTTEIIVYEAICTEFFCPDYWLVFGIHNWANVILKTIITVMIFLLGLKIPKDFMKSITVTIFIPIVAQEVFHCYLEIAFFGRFFIADPKEKKHYDSYYLHWTPKFVNLFFSYIHYNCLILMMLLLHCCRLATKPGDHINLFPVNTVCLVLQVIPFFFSLIIYTESDVIHTTVIAISMLSRCVTIFGFIAFFAQLICAIPLVLRQLPYDHAAAPDLQLQDARSRLAWTMGYCSVPLIALLPVLGEALAWIVVLGNPKDETMEWITVFAKLFDYEVKYYRSTYLVLLTMFCLPPYRRAALLVFCPGAKVDALPRRPKETSNMYKFAA